MPQIPSKRNAALEAMEADWREFEAPHAWKRSRKGNLWRNWRGVTLTIYGRSDGWYGWVIADEDGPRYSPSGYETEAECMDALGSELEVGE